MKDYLSRKYVLLLLVLLGAVFFGAAYLYLSSEERSVGFDSSILEDRSRALEYADRIGSIDNRLAQDQILAAIIEVGDISRCSVADNVVVDGVNYGVVCRNGIAFDLAMKTRDLSYCGQLDDQLMSRTDCRNQILITRAIDGDNISVCAAVADPKEKLNCEMAFWLTSAVNTKNINLCVNWPTEKVGECKTRYALRLLVTSANDLDCNLVEESKDCQTTKNVWQQRNDPQKLCVGVEHPGWRAACYGRPV